MIISTAFYLSLSHFKEYLIIHIRPIKDNSKGRKKNELEKQEINPLKAEQQKGNITT